MRVERLLHNHLQKSVVMHSKRLDSLMCAVTAGMKERCVTVTGLGRHLRMRIKVKNKIKKIDRLVGNTHLHQEIPSLYECLGKWILGNINRPIIIVDWSPLGRVRNRTHYLPSDIEEWSPIKSLYPRATSRPQYIGYCQLSRRTSVPCGLYLYKNRSKGRQLKTLKGAKSRQATSLKIAQREREPWLIATSLKHNATLIRKIMKIYAKRAQIENGFRDTKNQRLGFSLNDSKTTGIDRLNVLLLIIAIATFGLWLLGSLVKQKQLHFQFQANTIRDRNVLSNVFLGWQIINNGSPHFKLADWLSVLNSISIIFDYESIL